MDVTVGSLTFRVRGDDAQLRTLVNEWEARRLTLGVDVKGAAEGAAALGRLTTAVTELTGKLDALGGRQRVVVQEVERVDSGTRRAALGVSNLTAQLSRGAVGAQTYAQQTDILGRALRDVSAQEGIFSRETAVAEGALRKLAAVDLRALRQNATRELATVTQAVREANSLRLDWQNLRLSDSDTLARLEQQRRGYQNAQDALAGQISSLREKGVLDEAEMSRVDRLTRYYERYGQALRTLGSIEASIQGQIQKGSLADSVQRGTDAELRALTQAAREAAAGVRLLQDQERAGLITKRELLAALTQERTAITAQVTAIREEAAALRGLDAPSAQQLARLEALTTAERGYTAALAQTARAQQEVARSQSVVRAGLMGAGGNGRLNDAAMAASFVSPELGMLGMAATAGPWVAGAAAAGVFGKALTDAAGKAADFRAQLQQVQAVSGLSGEAINRYGEFVQRLSTQLPVTTAQLTEMGRQAVMVGLHGEEGMRVYTQNMAALSVILRDVTGESQDLERTGQEIVKVLRAVGMNSDEVTQNFGRMVNGMVALKTESGVMIPEVTQLLKFWASQGAHMGLTIEQMTALSAALIQTGARAQGAGGALAIFYDKAAAAAAKGVSGITPWARIIGLTADETARLLKTDPMAFLQRFVDGVNRAEKNGTALALSLGSVDLNSQQVRRTLAELTQALPLLNNNIRVMNEGADDTGRALDVAQEAAQNYRDKMQMLHSAVNRIIVDLGGPLAETFTGWLTALEPLVVKVGDLIEKLNKVKSPGELKALLKIDWAKDSGTTVAYKLFLGSFQQMKEVKEAAGQNPILTGIGMVLSGRVAAGTLQAAGRDAYVRNVRSQLVDMGVLPSTGDPKVIKQQLELVAENLGKYEAMLAQRINQGAQAIRAAAGQPAPINVAAQAFNATGPLLPNQYRTDPSKEAGNFSYAFISQLAGVFKNDPRVASDCAIIAYEILNQLGIKIKGSAVQNANVGVLEKNAIASGFQKVDGQEIRPGDLVIWTSGNGKTYGVSSGKHAGVVAGFDGKNLKVIENPGTRNGRDSITQVVSMYDWQNATVYRAPNSPFATGKPTAPRSSSAPAPADQESPITAAQVVKAQQLLAAVEKTQAALKAKPGDVGLTKALDAATTAMNNWSKAAPEHARALAAVRAGMGGTAEAARTASGAYIATAADLKKYGADALRLQKDLDKARESGSAQAIATAERNMQAWLGESEVKKAVLAAETAAYRARQQQAAEAQRQTERDSAPARTQAEIRAQEKLEKAIRNASRARLEQLAAGTVGENGLTLDKWKAARAEIERRDRAEAESRKRNKEVAQQLAGMNQAQRQAQVQAAQDELTRLQNDRQARLNAVKGNAAATLQVEKETAGAIQAQEEKLALTRLVAAKRQAEEEKKARIAAIPQGATAAQRQALEASAQAEYLGKISSAYRTYALTVSKSQQDAAQAVQAATEQQGDKLRSLRDEYSRLAQGMRDKIAAGKVEQADLTAYLRGLDELEGKAKKAGLTNDQHVRGARASAEALYQQGIDAQIAAGAFGDLADSHDRAAKASAGYTVTLEDALAQLPTGTSATETYVRALEDLAAQGKVSKDVLDAVKQTIADRTVKWQLEADAIARVTKEGLDNAQALSDLGDTEGAINSLYTVLNDLYTRLENGEDVADAINQVTDAINGLGAALELDTEFNTFIAGLSGTLSDQIDQVVSRLDEVTDNPQLAARLKAYLADLRKQFAQAYNTDPYSAGYINNGSVPSKTSGPDYQTIARARDLGTALAEETDPAQLQGLMAEITEFLASDIAQSLPEATRKGLEDGVRDAQGYINILGSITEDTITDGWERATKNVKPPPTNEFTDWADKIFGLGRAGLADPTQKNALVESLQQARAESRLTEADLQNLLALIDEFTRELEPDTIGKAFDFGQWQRGVQELTDWFDSGTITAEQYTEGLHNAASELYEMAAAAEAAGNIPLAQRFREQAVALRALNPEIARTLRTLGKVQEYAGYVQDLAGAFGQLADAAGNGDLAANLNGIGNLAGKAAALAGDVMRIIANPADIGAWVGAITKVIGGIAEALGGFKKAHAEAKRLKDEFQDQNPLLNAGDYQKTFVRSRGFFADLFGGGPEVVNEVDKLGYLFARTMQSSFVDGITNGLKEAILKNDFSLFSGKLRETVYGGLLDGVIDLFLNDTLLKEIIAPAIKAWSDALKTPDTADDAAALAGIDAAIDQVDQRASRFYSDVAPKLQGIGEKWGIDQGGAAGNSSRDLIGAPPAAQLGIPRIEVSFPADALRPLTDFGNAVPVFARASDTLLRAAELLLQRGGSGGPPPLSGSGSLV